MVLIRRLQFGEVQLFRRMRLASLQDAPHAFSSTYESALLRSAESWREQADSTAQGAERATFIAFSDDTPIGIAALYRLPGHTDVGETLQVWVAPEHRGKGIARGLMNALFVWASQNGFRRVIATLTKENARAIGFYCKYGFALPNEPSQTAPQDVVLAREVKPLSSAPTESSEKAA